jgi:hypothetical protein
MEIRVRLEGIVSLQDGEVNINEILNAVGKWGREMTVKIAQGTVNAYQGRVVELLCAGQGRQSWLPHEAKGCKGQMCLGGGYRGGGKRECRGLRTELGALKVETWQVVCGICGKRFRVLGPLLKVAARARPTIGLKHMMAETMTDLSYRKGGGRMAALAQVEVPHSTAQRWMVGGDWDALQEPSFSATTWESFQGLMADGTGYKRQKAETTRGELRLLMGVTGSPRRLVPLGAWADKSWAEIDEQMLAQKPQDIKPPVIAVDGERGQEVLSNLAQDIQRCQWHVPHQLGHALWEDGLRKPERDPHLNKLSGIIKIELPSGDYRSIPQEIRDQIQGQVLEGKEAMNALVRSFQHKGYLAAAGYLRNATEHTFTVVEKWLELGYMPPKAISLLERVMREMGRRIKKIGASWKDKGVLAVARVLLTRIYDPKRWREYWEKLLDLHGRCVVQDVSLSFSVS